MSLRAARWSEKSGRCSQDCFLSDCPMISWTGFCPSSNELSLIKGGVAAPIICLRGRHPRNRLPCEDAKPTTGCRAVTALADKEMPCDVWNHNTAKEAKSYFRSRYHSAIRSTLNPMKALAQSRKERVDNIVTYCTHRITNGVAEGMNSKIKSIKRSIGG